MPSGASDAVTQTKRLFVGTGGSAKHVALQLVATTPHDCVGTNWEPRQRGLGESLYLGHPGWIPCIKMEPGRGHMLGLGHGNASKIC